MKILHVISSVNPAGGGPIEGVQRIGEALAALGHTAEIASLDEPSAPWVRQIPMTIHALGPSRLGYAYSPRMVPWLRRNVSRFDAVIVQGVWQFHGCAAWLALRHSRTPYLVFTHGMLDPWFKQAYPLKHLKKCVYWLGLEHRVLRDATRVCFTCDEERVLARDSFRPYTCREVVVPYGTARVPDNEEGQRAAFRQRFPALGSKRVLLFLGRIHPKKGCDLLLEAFAHAASREPDLHLMMAGPDQIGWSRELQKKAQSLGIAEHVSWPGMLEGEEKWGAFRCAEAFVLPSHQENFGIAVAEALACGTPVLISNKVNIWREIQQDNAGLVEADTPAGIQRLLERWIEIPPERKEAMRHASMQCFEARFEVSRTVAALLATIEDARLERSR